jgi:hypothetical protein
VRRLGNEKFLCGRGADAAALAGLAFFFVAFFPQGLFGGRYLFTGDGFFYNYALRTVAWGMIRAGEWPVWTPHVMSGYPLLSMAQLGLGYPLTWGYLFLPGRVAEQIYMLAPFLLAPGFTYAYLRELNRTPLAALLGALTFGYGGLLASPIANNGLLPNAVMWLPLMLIALERARRRPFVPCLLGATAAYTMSVLTGVGQGFLYVGLLAGAYALWLALVGPRADKAQADEAQEDAADARTTQSQGAVELRFARWRPLLAAGLAGVLATGVAAFQFLETARVVRRSVRSTLSYDLFTQGSFTPALLWKSITTPLFYTFDVHAYVPPLALALTICAVWTHAQSRNAVRRDPRVFFWLAVALCALVLMLGQHTPVYRLVYRTPLLNRFRVPARHTFEWTFAIGVLAAYGWDALTDYFARRRAASETSSARGFGSRRFELFVALALLTTACTVGALWWLKSQPMRPGMDETGALAPTNVYRLWKTAFVLLTAAALWRANLLAHARRRFGVLLACVLVTCFVEPSLLVAHWWGRVNLSAARFSVPGEATRFMWQFPPEAGRVYTRVDLFNEQFDVPPRFDAPNLSAVWGLHNVAGYEPLILERYSRALGGTGLDTVRTFETGLPDPSLLDARSHVLDLLNTTHLVAYTRLATANYAATGSSIGLGVPGEIAPGETKKLGALPGAADSLELITSLANATFEPDGATVARVHVRAADGRTVELELQAGRDTSEWAHERADVRALMRHRLAPVAESTFVSDNAGGGFTAYRFKTVLPFGAPLEVKRVDIENVSQTARLALYDATLREMATGRAASLFGLYSEAWRPVYERHDTVILHNTRALPRAWLVAEAEAVGGDEALWRIRGEVPRAFDPRRTALLEVRPDALPPLPGGALAPGSTARVVNYEPNRLAIETDAPTPTVLIVSEIIYPGWEATVDGRPAQIGVADYLLRSVALPAGRHRVEMRYVAPGARAGACLSALTLGLLAGLAIYARRTRARQAT